MHYWPIFWAWPRDRLFGILTILHRWKKGVRRYFMCDLKDISWPNLTSRFVNVLLLSKAMNAVRDLILDMNAVIAQISFDRKVTAAQCCFRQEKRKKSPFNLHIYFFYWLKYILQFWVIHFLLHSLHFYSSALFPPSTPSLYTTSPPLQPLMAALEDLISLSLYLSLSFSPSAYLTCSGSWGHPEFCWMLHAAVHSVKSAIVCRTHRNFSPTGDAHISKKTSFVIYELLFVPDTQMDAETLKHVHSV